MKLYSKLIISKEQVILQSFMRMNTIRFAVIKLIMSKLGLSNLSISNDVTATIMINYCTHSKPGTL